MSGEGGHGRGGEGTRVERGVMVEWGGGRHLLKSMSCYTVMVWGGAFQ